IWGSDPYPSSVGNDRNVPSHGPVALLDLSNYPLINITDLARLYRVDMPGGEGPTAFAWDYWNEPSNYLVRLTLAFASPVVLEVSLLFRCSSPAHWAYLRWIGENDGMVPLADEFAGPISEERDSSPRNMLLAQVGGADELSKWLGGIK